MIRIRIRILTIIMQVKEISKNFALEIKKLEIVLKKQEVVRDTLVVRILLKIPSLSCKMPVRCLTRW